MTVFVVYTTQVKAALGIAREAVELDAPCTVAELLERLSDRHGETFRNLVLDHNGKLLPSILLCIGDEQVDADSNTTLNDGDEFTLLSAISGG